MHFEFLGSFSSELMVEIQGVFLVFPQASRPLLETLSKEWLAVGRAVPWLVTCGQQSQLPSSIYTGHRKGTQLSQGTESSSLMKPLVIAPQPFTALLMKYGAFPGPFGKICTLVYSVCFTSSRNVSGAMLMTLQFLFAVMISFSLEDLFCHIGM